MRIAQIGRRRKFTPQEEEKIARLKNEGLPLTIIAKRFDCPPQTIKQVLKRREK